MSIGMKLGIGRALMMEAEERRQKELIEEERAYERENFQTKLREQRRDKLLDLGIAWRKQVSEGSALVNAAVGIGVSEKAAIAMSRTGQLGTFMDIYKSNESVDPEYITALNASIERQLEGVDDTTLSDAMIAGVSTERDVSDPRQASAAMVEAILAASTDEEMDKLYVELSRPSTTTQKPFAVDFSTMSGLTLAETAAIRREVGSTLATYFKDSVTLSEQGEPIVNQTSKDAPIVSQILNEAEREARRLASGPDRRMVATNAANFVSTSLEKALTATKGADVGVVLDNLGLIFTDPDAFVEQYTVAPPPPETPVVETQEQAVEGMTKQDFGFDINDFAPRK